MARGKYLERGFKRIENIKNKAAYIALLEKLTKEPLYLDEMGIRDLRNMSALEKMGLTNYCEEQKTYTISPFGEVIMGDIREKMR